MLKNPSHYDEDESYYPENDIHTEEIPREDYDDEEVEEHDDESNYFFDKEEEEEVDTFTEDSRSPRYLAWSLLFFLSLIATGSALEARDAPINHTKTAEDNQKWVISCAVISLFLTTTVVIMHSFSLTAIFIINTRLEAFLIVLVSSFWAATSAVVCNTENGLAVNSNGYVSYGNLYYSSWGGFLCCLYLIFSYIRSGFYYDPIVEFRSRSSRLVLWFLLMIFCLVTMGSSAYIFDDMCGDDYIVSSPYCRRTKFAITIGALGVVLSFIVMGMRIALSTPELGLVSKHIHFQFEALSSFVLFATFCAGLGFVTSAQGPGSAIGNLFYSLWGCILTLFMISMSCYEEYRKERLKKLVDQSDAEDGMIFQEHDFNPDYEFDSESRPNSSFIPQYDQYEDNVTYDQGENTYANQQLSYRSNISR